MMDIPTIAERREDNSDPTAWMATTVPTPANVEG